MVEPRRIVLRCNSNVEQYDLSIYDGKNCLRKRVFARQACLCFCAYAPCLKIVATARVNGVLTSLYFWVDRSCSEEISLYFNFPQVPTSGGSLNGFTLTDATYGLPIDGTLIFTAT